MSVILDFELTNDTPYLALEVEVPGVYCVYIGNKSSWYNEWLICMPIKAIPTRTPSFWWYPPPPHDYPYYWVTLDPKSKEDKVKVTTLKNSPKFQFLKFWYKHYTRHTFSNCLIQYANMKWIRHVLLKIQSGHDSIHKWTDGQTDKVKPVYPLSTSLKRRV